MTHRHYTGIQSSHSMLSWEKYLRTWKIFQYNVNRKTRLANKFIL